MGEKDKIMENQSEDESVGLSDQARETLRGKTLASRGRDGVARVTVEADSPLTHEEVQRWIEEIDGQGGCFDEENGAEGEEKVSDVKTGIARRTKILFEGGSNISRLPRYVGAITEVVNMKSQRELREIVTRYIEISKNEGIPFVYEDFIKANRDLADLVEFLISYNEEYEIKNSPVSINTLSRFVVLPFEIRIKKTPIKSFNRKSISGLVKSLFKRGKARDGESSSRVVDFYVYSYRLAFDPSQGVFFLDCDDGDEHKRLNILFQKYYCAD